MSKGLGQKIGIKFTEPLIVPRTNLVNKALGKPVTGSNAIVSYGPGTVTDGIKVLDPLSYAEIVGAPAWIQVDLGEIFKIAATKIWHYYGGTRTYYGTKTQVSVDGINWTTVFDSAVSGTYQETAEGKYVIFPSELDVRYVRDYLNGNTSNGGNHWMEIEIYAYEPGFSTQGFTVTGRQEVYIGGPVVNKTYTLSSIEPHPTEENAILLTTGPLTRFNNVVGDLKVNYDASSGQLIGAGGSVESFEVIFTPTELVAKPNPNAMEHLSVSALGTGVLSKVTYSQAYVSETIVASASATAVLTYVGVVNP